MTFEELNAEMKVLLESENFEQAKNLWKQEESNIASFDESQKYMIYEKIMICQYKNGFYEESLRINKGLESMTFLGDQYVLTANLWRVNIELAQKKYSRAMYSANMLILRLPEEEIYAQRLKSETNNIMLRIYIESGKYARMKKLFRKMLRENLDEHSKSKMLMNVGVAYYSLGKYDASIKLFLHILTITEDCFFVGCANLYLARMFLGEQKKRFYIKAIENFQKIKNEHMLSICEQEINGIF